jgi:hypothetical protein
MTLALVPSAPQAITAYVEEATMDPAITQLQQVVQKTYQWVDAQYKTEALEHLWGLHLAYQCDLSTQATLHKHKIQEFFIRDFVKRSAPSLPNHNNYNGFVCPISEDFGRYSYDTRLRLRLPAAPYESTWQFYRIAEYKSLIPPVALHFLAALTQVLLTRDDFWVAVYRPPEDTSVTATNRRTAVDPILFANCRCALVALADWV